MHVPTFIERKRDGHALTAEEIAEFIRGYASGEIPDYQAAAWAMAVFFRGMDPAETSALTRAMMHSGRVLAHPPGSPPKVDKHSTGGIGDKVSLILAPLLACDGLWVPMISGRGLGITGGTLDKLESIPGFRVGLSEAESAAQLAKLGVVMIGQTADLCPADKKLYALRDVTATVPSIPLIVASIMSKKLAETLDRLVLDVKFGSGAFMQTRADAEALAAALTAVGNEMGVQTSHILTPMDEPLGRTVGNALEVAESVDTLQGRGPADLIALTLDLAERVANSPRATLTRWLEDGTAWRKFVAMVETQDGDTTKLERIAEVHPAPIIRDVPAPHAGKITKLDAGAIGRAGVLLGAGRAKASDAVDYAVGFSAIRKIGDAVKSGEPLLRIHARDEATLAAALAQLEGALAVQ
ncbi:MAG: thymidine phosphorylase [Chthoniobacteraceae bacterium]